MAPTLAVLGLFLLEVNIMDKVNSQNVFQLITECVYRKFKVEAELFRLFITDGVLLLCIVPKRAGKLLSAPFLI